MSDSGREKSSAPRLPKPQVRPMRWPAWVIWIVPIVAAVIAAIYYVDYRRDNAKEIVIRFASADGLKPGETPVEHLGVEIGTVSSLELTGDGSAVLVHVELHQAAADFARAGTVFWIERAQLSAGSVSGISTIVSGPYIDSTPGGGPEATQFTGLNDRPVNDGPGLIIMLHTARLAHLDRDSGVYFRGIQVGAVKSVALNANASGVDIEVFIRERYAPLVRAGSEFWIESGVDFSGGIFSGLKLNVESMRALLGGALAFATPDGQSAPIGQRASFDLNDEPKKEWLDWGTDIPIAPDEGGDQSKEEPAQPPVETPQPGASSATPKGK